MLGKSAGRMLLGLVAMATFASPALAGPEPPESTRPPDAFERRLLAEGREDLAERWRSAVRLEGTALDLSDTDPTAAKPLFLSAAELFDGIASETEGSGAPYWQSARCHWLLGETLPIENKEERLEHFTIADERAGAGISVDPDCAECMLWKFTSMGRLRTTQGVIAGLRGVHVMADLLDRGIELAPRHRDGQDNSTLGNLHYGSAIFYRVLPDWMWLGWFLGVRGDKDRALSHARQALALHPARFDYQLEVGSQLLCLGATRRHRQRLDEGARLLEALLDSPVEGQREERHLAAAEVMLASPAKSCSYTGDTWVEIDAQEAATSVPPR